MDRYPRELFPALRSIANGTVEVREYRPRYVRLPGLSRSWSDRFARYGAYPAQAAMQRGDFYHIVDHGYAHLLSVLDAKRAVVTVHDLIPLLQAAGEFGPRSPHPFASFSAKFLRKAGALIADSDNTRRDLGRLLGIDPAKVHVAFPGVNAAFKPDPRPREIIRGNLGLPKEAGPIILVSGRQFYKNHETSVRVLARLIGMGHPKAVLACLSGPGDSAEALARQLGVEDRVIRMRGLSEQQLISLYGAVDCLLFASLYEGFGWPPLEAMACGTPVVCSNAASLPEVVGSAAITSAPTDVQAHAAAVSRLITDPAFRSEMIARGREHVARFTWENCARQVLEVYGSVSK
jgi:glycosyltransferase involved in cell wall biosynthesis